MLTHAFTYGMLPSRVRALQQRYSCRHAAARCRPAGPCRHAAARCVDVCTAHALTYDDTNALLVFPCDRVAAAGPAAAAARAHTHTRGSSRRRACQQQVYINIGRCCSAAAPYLRTEQAESMPAAARAHKWKQQACRACQQQVERGTRQHAQREREGWCHHTSTHVLRIRQRI